MDARDWRRGEGSGDNPFVTDVLRLRETSATEMTALLARFDLRMLHVAPSEPIPGSYWGAPEAGLIGDRLYARADTPVHSILHETSHYVCMTPSRRRGLDRDAGGDDLEESAVCYFQILLADRVPEMGRERMFRDMDAWGYSFRLGSTAEWFRRDAEDARLWLLDSGLIDENRAPLWRLRSRLQEQT